MEKLIMLLDIYEEEVVGVHSVGDKITEKEEVWICSKKFGFIKWLVDNDKIDFNKVDRVGSGDFLYPMDTLWGNVTCEREYFEEYNEYDRIVMLLAISDTPIDDLISYLR